MTKHVFVSYSTQDTAAATQVRDGLESAGLVCWMAPRDIAPRLDYAQQIIGVIEAHRHHPRDHRHLENHHRAGGVGAGTPRLGAIPAAVAQLSDDLRFYQKARHLVLLLRHSKG